MDKEEIGGSVSRKSSLRFASITIGAAQLILVILFASASSKFDILESNTDFSAGYSLFLV
jgi:hypothetical protein